MDILQVDICSAGGFAEAKRIAALASTYDIYLPHGGIKNSGFGVDCSEFALDDYLIRKRVSQVLV